MNPESLDLEFNALSIEPPRHPTEINRHVRNQGDEGRRIGLLLVVGREEGGEGRGVVRGVNTRVWWRHSHALCNNQ